MGSKKKYKNESNTGSSSDSESSSSNSSPESNREAKSKRKHKKGSKYTEALSPSLESETCQQASERNSSHKREPSSENSAPKKSKVHASDNDQDRNSERKRNRSPIDDFRDQRAKDDRGRHGGGDRYTYEDRKRKHPDDRSGSDRHRDNRHVDQRNRERRGRRDDRERDYRNRRENYRHHSDNRERNRNFRDDRRRRSRSKSFDHANATWGRSDNSDKNKESTEKQKPNFGLSGKLTEETNTYKGVVIKYSEPPEARKPKRRWRLYPFKGEKALQTLYIHRESAYLIGRDRKVVDLPVDHPSCSKQHAVLQYRLVPFTREDGSIGKRVRPYLIDLNSANGTFINNKKIEPSKYVELLERDVIKFGFSSREYVLLHENSKDEAQDDDVKQEDEEVAVKQENE